MFTAESVRRWISSAWFEASARTKSRKKKVGSLLDLTASLLNFGVMLLLAAFMKTASQGVCLVSFRRLEGSNNTTLWLLAVGKQCALVVAQ